MGGLRLLRSRGGSKPPPYDVESISCAEGSVERGNSVSLPLTGEVARFCVTERAVYLPRRGKGDYFACKMVDEVLMKSLILHLSVGEMRHLFL